MTQTEIERRMVIFPEEVRRNINRVYLEQRVAWANALVRREVTIDELMAPGKRLGVLAIASIAAHVALELEVIVVSGPTLNQGGKNG